MLSVADTAAELMEHLANHNAHGYSQPNRGGIGTGGGVGEYVTVSDGRTYGIALGDRDCSSAAIECYAAQGIDCGGAYYTGDMVADMVASGNFEKLPGSTWREAGRGNLLVATGKHTAMALGGGKLGEAAISETGGLHGQVGDQTGYEIRIRDMYDDGWDAVLRYCGPEREDEVTDADIEAIAEKVADKVIMGTPIDGNNLYNRLLGIDNLTQANYKQLHRTDDPSGRGVEMNLYEHFKWVAAAIQTGLDYLKAIAAKVGADIPQK